MVVVRVTESVSFKDLRLTTVRMYRPLTFRTL
jgi:hypothetical protein